MSGHNIAQKMDQRLAIIHRGDPLGLKKTRPPPPADPEPYDREHDDKYYARSLVGIIADDEFMDIRAVRAFIEGNTTKGSLEAAGLDPDIMISVDARINYKVFIAGDHIYTREELYEYFAFHEMNVTPESIFVQQEIGEFFAGPDEFVYVARDIGDDTDFMPIEDVGLPCPRKPIRTVKTKIYVGKQQWEDFSLIQRVCRGAINLATIQGSTPLLLTAALSATPLLSAKPLSTATPLLSAAKQEEAAVPPHAQIAMLEQMIYQQQEKMERQQLEFKQQQMELEHALADLKQKFKITKNIFKRIVSKLQYSNE